MKRIFIIPDIHSPYHDRLAMRLIRQAILSFKPHIVIQLGDLADCYSLSSFNKDPLRRKIFKDEIEVTNKMLDSLDLVSDITAEEKIVTLGNHEERLDTYLQSRAPMLVGTKGMSIAEQLNLGSRGWKVYPYKDYCKIGKVIYTHDLDFGNAGVARKALQDAQHTIVVGHAHRIEEVVGGDATGVTKYAGCYGWLGDPASADYKHRLKANRDWSHGFGIGYLEPGGITHLRAVPIVNNKCVIDGVLLKVK